ncbi:ubiquitin carboxyl-terminal hydrolase domain-containing protein [Sarocladium implicatum]|nr:ubiquitin carboxyl-terminal hydrolase domain-containing protein [Sarocladium implicatum]
MAGFLSKIKSAGAPSAGPAAKDAAAKKNLAEPAPEATPLEKMLQNAGPLREDGSDRFFGFENFGNTCYCNSIVQALFYSDMFRDHVIQYPPLSPADSPNGVRPKVNVSIRPPVAKEASNPQQQLDKNGKVKGLSSSQVIKQRQAINSGQLGPNGQPIRPEDKPDTPEYKKKQAMLKGPILELASENALPYGMEESTFTGLKDIFLALQESDTRIGVLSPQRFLEIFKRDNELFRTSMHQDAHEFYGLVLNDVINNVEANARKMQEIENAKRDASLAQSVENAIGSTMMNNMNGYRSPGTGWVHDIFEGLLTSETKCLTCETASQRDETFLDLSIDLEEHSSVTSCLRKFSAEEMLCERNKFHCDHCGGLQEAEKRMKVKKLPKVLTLHLKRFKYTEDYSRLQKLFHRVVYPYHLRMFNTADEAEDPDRLYELYAVVVHIGGNAYHGHYVSIIKTKDRGWLLFDDEMVEPVDKHFVRNFFGDKPGMATAYVLFYQETTFEKVRKEQEAEGMEEVMLANQAANMAQEDGEKNDTAPLRRQATQPISPLQHHDSMNNLAHARTAPEMPSPGVTSPAADAPPVPAAPAPRELTKEEKKREKKEREAAEKAEKEAEKERAKQAKADYKAKREAQAKIFEQQRKDREEQAKREKDELAKVLEESKRTAAKESSSRKEEPSTDGGLDRSKRGSKSMTKKSFGLFSKDRSASGSLANGENGDTTPDAKEKLKGRLSMSLGRKKSANILS